VNPCALVERPGHETPRERLLTDNELCELWPEFERLGYPFGALFQLALILGQRRSEIAGMRWDDVDLDAKTWTLASEATKSGRRHVVPLPEMAVDIIETLPRKTMSMPNGMTRPSPFVLTTDGSMPVSGFSKAKSRINDRIAAARAEGEFDPMPQWGIHDLRRTCATGMAKLGTSESIIGRVLNHAAKGVTSTVYNRYEYLAEKKHALDSWAQHLDGLVHPKPDNVAPIDARRALVR